MSPYRETAFAIAEALAGAPGAHSGHWTGDTLDADGAGGHAVLSGEDIGSDLYSGSVGIGWALAHIARAGGPAIASDTACAALDGALREAEDMVDQQKLALHSGAAGIALAAYEGGKALGNGALTSAAKSLMLRVAATAPQWTNHEVDLIGGRAGIVVAMLALDALEPDDALQASVAALCEQLVQSARKGWWGYDWPGIANVGLCGLAHGASGVGWALAEAGARTGDSRFTQAGNAALLYEAGWFDVPHGSWPDLRTRERSPTDPPGWMDAWCHGAVGIGAVRWCLWQRNRDSMMLAQASSAMLAARRYVVAAGQSVPGVIADMTLCHGLAGAAELMLIAHEATGRAEHLRAARRVGDLILRLREANDGRWTVGLPGGSDVPGLFLGIAGIAAVMLRLDDPTTMGSPALTGRPAAPS